MTEKSSLADALPAHVGLRSAILISKLFHFFVGMVASLGCCKPKPTARR